MGVSVWLCVFALWHTTDGFIQMKLSTTPKAILISTRLWILMQKLHKYKNSFSDSHGSASSWSTGMACRQAGIQAGRKIAGSPAPSIITGIYFSIINRNVLNVLMKLSFFHVIYSLCHDVTSNNINTLGEIVQKISSFLFCNRMERCVALDGTRLSWQGGPISRMWLWIYTYEKKTKNLSNFLLQYSYLG